MNRRFFRSIYIINANRLRALINAREFELRSDRIRHFHSCANEEFFGGIVAMVAVRDEDVAHGGFKFDGKTGMQAVQQYYEKSANYGLDGKD